MSSYPFDSSGTLPSNRIDGEPHVISELNGLDHAYIIPKAAPFYERSMVVVSGITGRPLVLNEDYYFAYPYEEATIQIGQPISSGIAFINPDATGSYYLVYQTLGSDYVNSLAPYIQNGFDTLDRLTTIDWADIADLPTEFPPTLHMERLDSIEGMADFLSKMEGLKEAIAMPRRITAADIDGLDVELYAPLLETLGQVAQSVATMATAQNLMVQHVNSSSNNTNRDIMTPLAGVWYDSEVSLTIQQSGLYLLTVESFAKAFSDTNGLGDVRHRWRVNGNELATSRLSNVMVPFQQDDVVTLQFMTTAPGQLTRISYNGSTYGCAMTAMKVRSLT